MKKLYCKECGTLVIEIEKGRVKHNTHTICNNCAKRKDLKEQDNYIIDFLKGFNR